MSKSTILTKNDPILSKVIFLLEHPGSCVTNWRVYPVMIISWKWIQWTFLKLLYGYFKKNAILWSTQHKHGKCRGVYSSEIRLTHGWAFGRGSHRTIAGCYMCALKKKTLVCLWYFRRRFWCRFQKNIHPWGNVIEQYWQRIPKNKLRH